MFLLTLPLLLLWAAWVVQAWLCAWQVRKFAGRFDHRSRTGLPYHQPPAVVIVPFRGIDTDLPSAVAALCHQKYADYRLFCVVESTHDRAHGVLARELARYPNTRAEILVAGVAGKTEGQKVHNQLFAIDKLLAEADAPGAPEVWVFADSDAVPGPNWLGDLVAPLRAKTGEVGLTTGYRWLIPAEPDTAVSARIASVLNSSVACFFGQERFNHAWGGSMAILAKTARAGDLRGHLDGALCDDYQFSRVVRNLGLKIFFVRHCLVASPVNFHWQEFVNFAHRQYLLTRVYAPMLFLAALAIQSLYLLGFAAAWLALLGGLALGLQGYVTISAAAALILVLIANHVRAHQRLRIIVKAFGPEVARRLKPTLFLDRWGTTLCMAVHWMLVLRSAFGRTMKWRGIYYRLYGPQSCRRLNRG